MFCLLKKIFLQEVKDVKISSANADSAKKLDKLITDNRDLKRKIQNLEKDNEKLQKK